jgi:hypothetical protein
MRPVLALGVLVALCASADAATVHRSKPSTVHLRTRQHVIVRPSPGVTAPGRFFTFPGWKPIPPEENRNLDPSNRGSA